MVQGVGFRLGAARIASTLGLTGWIRNLPDGRVETFAQGALEAVEEYRRWLHRGPRGAVVVRVVEEQAINDASLLEFQIR